jgi:transposase
LIGAALKISPSCVSKWAKLKRETGGLKPLPIGGRKPRTLSGEIAEWLRERMGKAPFTTRGLARELAERASRRPAARSGFLFGATA